MKSSSVSLRVALSVTVIMLFLHATQGSLSAQTTNGMIQGTVRDPSGAPISGVNVKQELLKA
jgi:hypothetical protein